VSTNILKEYTKSIFRVDEVGDSMVLGKVGIYQTLCRHDPEDHSMNPDFSQDLKFLVETRELFLFFCKIFFIWCLHGEELLNCSYSNAHILDF
jgi:hypothetical protein